MSVICHCHVISIAHIRAHLIKHGPVITLRQAKITRAALHRLAASERVANDLKREPAAGLCRVCTTSLLNAILAESAHMYPPKPEAA